MILAGCAGIGTPYSTPAKKHEIDFSVEPITVPLVDELQQIIAPDSRVEIIPAPEAYTYRIGSGDFLSIVIRQPGLPARSEDGGEGPDPQTTYLVTEQGEIFLPFHGALRVGGLTVGEAFEAIRDAMSNYLTRPQINVRVSEFRSQQITVTGELENGGFQPITDRPLSLTEAILIAKPSESADLTRVMLKRNGEQKPIDVEALIDSASFGAGYVLQGDDVIVVPENTNTAYVLGEAPNQARRITLGETTLANALLGEPGDRSQQQSRGQNQSGGFLQAGVANPGSIFVIRGEEGKARVFHLNARSPGAFLLADQFYLKNRDVVFVSTREVTRFNRFVTQLLPSLQNLITPLFIINQADDALN